MARILHGTGNDDYVANRKMKTYSQIVHASFVGPGLISGVLKRLGIIPPAHPTNTSIAGSFAINRTIAKILPCGRAANPCGPDDKECHVALGILRAVGKNYYTSMFYSWQKLPITRK